MTTATLDRERPLTAATSRRLRSPIGELKIPDARPNDPTITAEIVHDFRNTLAAVSMLSEIMMGELRNLPHESAVREIALDVSRGCADALELCDRLLPTPGRDSPSGEEVSLLELVTHIAPLLNMYVRPPSRLQLELADDLPLLESEPRAVRRILMNLVKNAGEALDRRGGRVTVRTGWIDLDAAELPDLDEDAPRRSGLRQCLTVCDDGCGMDDLTRSRLLRSTITNKHNGHGLGMASVRRMAAQLGTRVLIESQVGAGTTVRVVFTDAVRPPPPPERRQR